MARTHIGTSLITPLDANLAAGSNKITGLANGTASTDSAAFGQLKIIQVVNGSTGSQVVSTSATFVDTNLTASITPTSSSNKVLVFINQQYSAGTSAAQSGAALSMRLLRGASTLNTAALAGGFSNGANLVQTLFGVYSISFMDSPATTSATTYKTQFARGGGTDGTLTVQNSSQESFITLMEVAP